MGNIKHWISLILAVLLTALCFLAITGDLHISVKVLSVFSAVSGFFALHKWRKRK